MEEIRVSSQSELDAALAAGKYPICIGDKYFEVRGSSQITACDSSQITACDSSQITACDRSWVTAYGGSQVTACDRSQVTAYGRSQVKACDSSQVKACDSSQVTAYGRSQVTACDRSWVMAYGSSQVTAYGSSQITACDISQIMACDRSWVKAHGSSQVMACNSSQVTAYGSSQVKACGSSQVTATRWVAVTRSQRAIVEGGNVIELPVLDTPESWCEFYGVPIIEGVVILYKALDEEFKSKYKTCYAPGLTPIAEDWDGGVQECGKGLHFSPRPFMAIQFHPTASKFAGCPVALTDISVHPNASYPSKIKARGCCGPCFEVDIDGNRILPTI